MELHLEKYMTFSHKNDKIMCNKIYSLFLCQEEDFAKLKKIAKKSQIMYYASKLS